MKFILLASMTLALAGCASGPGYAPAKSASAAGYSERMIEKHRWRVHYTGTTAMSSIEVQDYALMRAAQLTLERGADWFEIVDSDTDANAKNRYSTETGFSHDYAVQRSCGLLGCTSQAVPVTTRVEREIVQTRVAYEHSMEIVIGSGQHFATAARIYDAKDTFGTLKARLD
jgi:hypothetical protein